MNPNSAPKPLPNTEKARGWATASVLRRFMRWLNRPFYRYSTDDLLAAAEITFQIEVDHEFYGQPVRLFVVTSAQFAAMRALLQAGWSERAHWANIEIVPAPLFTIKPADKTTPQTVIAH